MKYTSKELSKKLADAGCRFDTENYHVYGLEVGIYTEFEIFMIEIGFVFILLALFSFLPCKIYSLL